MVTNIVRLPDKATGGITKKEKEEMDKITKKWVKRALFTGHIDTEIITEAIKKLYEVANLEEPVVVIVPSPDAMVEVFSVIGTLFDEERYEEAIECCKDISKIKKIKCNKNRKKEYQNSWSSFYQGGNFWAGNQSFTEAARDTLKLSALDWKTYQSWEDCAWNGGFRMLHEKFCVVSDFPCELHINEQNQAHNLDAPSHLWRDGFAIYTIAGVVVPQWLVETPASQLTMQQYQSISNADVKMAFIMKAGMERFLKQGTVVDSFENYTSRENNKGTWLESQGNYKHVMLSEYKLIDMGKLIGLEKAPYLYMKNQTTGVYHLEAVDKKCKTIKEALDFRYELDFNEFEIESIA
jgi:hypothetical protein